MYFATTNDFNTAGAKTRMTIDHRGNLGLGTTEPTQLITLAGAGGTRLEIARISASLPVSTNGSLDPGAFTINQQSAGSSNTQADLYVMRDRKVRIDLGDNNTYFSSQNTGDILFDINLDETCVLEAMHIVGATGNVGIGTPAPTALLSVNGSANKSGSPNWTVFSDERLKQNIIPFNEGLEKLLQIDPITFQYNGKGGITSKETYVGIVAQQIRKILPYTIKEVKMRMDPKDSSSIENILEFDPNAITYIIINSVKELNQQNSEQYKINKEFKSQMEAYRNSSKTFYDSKENIEKLKTENIKQQMQIDQLLKKIEALEKK